MKNGKAKNSGEKPNAQKEETAAEAISSGDNFINELREPRWSVVSFEKCAAKNLTYDEAVRNIAELEKQRVSGLCLITDDAAKRISGE
ncbi:MAG: hypothetical protein ACR2IA_01845 [Pyrinomonadaceae bacterium]